MAAPYGSKNLPDYSSQQQQQQNPGQNSSDQQASSGNQGYYPSTANPYPSNVIPPPPYQQRPAPNSQMPPPAGAQQTFVYIHNNALGPVPTSITCPHCQQRVISKIIYTAGLMTWLLVGGCVLFGFVFGCCLIPLCMDGCKDIEHYCSSCNGFIGQYRRLS